MNSDQFAIVDAEGEYRYASDKLPMTYAEAVEFIQDSEVNPNKKFPEWYPFKIVGFQEK